MSKPNVISTLALPPDVDQYLQENTNYTAWQGPEAMSRELFLERVQHAEGVIMSGHMVNEELLRHAPKLRIVSTASVGYNHFDLQAMKKAGVIGTHTPNVLDDTVADLVLALMLSTARRIPELDAMTKRGEWQKGNDRLLFGLDVHHKHLGIIGMGRIGEAIAQRAKLGFSMDVSYYNRSRRPDAEERLGITYRTLEELLQQSDFIVLMVPLSEETRQMIGAAQFRLMKPSAIFINASRGQTVDEAAMVKALQNGEIYGAGLDVFEQEPIPADHPLLRMPNVVTVPHIGSATAETRHKMASLAARNLVKGLAGSKEIYVVKELKELLQ